MKVAVSLTLLPRVVFSFKTVGYNFVANSRYVEWRDAVLTGNEHVFGSKPVGIELYDYEKDPLDRENLAGKVSTRKYSKNIRICLTVGCLTCRKDARRPGSASARPAAGQKP